MKEALLKAMNEQINAEFYSAYLYLSMAAQCDKDGFKGFANWMRVQAKEELAHGAHIFEYVLDRGFAPVMDTLAKPPTGFTNLKAMFEAVVKHEQCVTGLIENLAALAFKESDHRTYSFLQWYLDEQVEEEAAASLILQKIAYIGEDLSMLYQLDTELAGRVFVDPFEAQNSQTN